VWEYEINKKWVRFKKRIERGIEDLMIMGAEQFMYRPGDWSLNPELLPLNPESKVFRFHKFRYTPGPNAFDFDLNLLDLT
jgi:hypothetical protein